MDFKLEEDLWWITDVVLPSWAGFQSRHGPYASQDAPEPSDGSVRIVFAPEGRGIEPLTDEEVASVAWVVQNEAAMSASLLVKLLQTYPDLQEQSGYDADELVQYMPPVSRVQDFRHLVGLHSINVHPLRKDGVPYVGFELGCTWDEEHGLGVLMHGTRVVEIGHADTAILLWIARQDAEQP